MASRYKVSSRAQLKKKRFLLFGKGITRGTDVPPISDCSTSIGTLTGTEWRIDLTLWASCQLCLEI